MITIEICANSLPAALAAQEGGAKRVEFCDNMKDGGTTASHGALFLARQKLQIQLFPIIRPRGGDFLYTELEFEIMKLDLNFCRKIGCDGVVFGILMPDGSVDTERCLALKQLAGNMQLTFHRAFDRCSDPFKALEDIIKMGFNRILTSGLEKDVVKGASMLEKLVKKAAGRISIMPGSGVRPENLMQLIKATAATEYHSTAKSLTDGEMIYREIKTGDNLEEFYTETTSRKIVEQLVNIADSFKIYQC